jgi:predicted DNA-binding protein with PD1-like motif
MQSRLVSRQGEGRMRFVVLDQGEEVKQQLQALVKQEVIAAASFVALGAFEKATIAYFDWEQKKYQPIPVDHQVEVLSLLGDVVPGEDGKLNLHAHTVLGLPDGSTRGGHLMKGLVRPTLEITVTETPAHLVRRRQPGLGLALIEAD